MSIYSPKLIHQTRLSFKDNFTDYRKDLSALLLTSGKYLWLASDETCTIERLSLVNDNNFAQHKQFKIANFINLPASEDEEIDIEGLAYSNGYLWFTGSHSYKRKKVKKNKTDAENVERLTKIVSEANRYVLGRIPLLNGELVDAYQDPQNSNIQLSAAKLDIKDQSNVLMKALAKDSHLGAFIQAAIPSKDNGFDAEGIAVDGDKIFLGLRGPVLRSWAVILEFTVENTAPGIMNLRKEAGKLYKKHFVYLNGLGIRDLYKDGEDLLILAGATMDLDGKAYLYRLRNGVNLQEDSCNRPDIVIEIPYGEGKDRPEGIALFEKITGIPSVMVIYDSPKNERLFDPSGIIGDVFDLRMTNQNTHHGSIMDCVTSWLISLVQGK